MSRFTTEIEDGKKTLVWGFDRPMSEYFIQLIDNVTEEDEDVVFAISNVFTLTPHPEHLDKERWSTGELVELLQKDFANKVPQEHIDHMLLDLPF